MKIKQVILTKSFTGFYFDDQLAIKNGSAHHDGFMYFGEPATPGFKKIRQPGEAISIQIVLDNDVVGVGDCAAVQYSGAGGRDPLFLANDFIPFIEENIVPLLIGETIDEFKPLVEKYDHLHIDGKRLHTAVRYGLTQALLSACANYHHLTMAEIVRKEYGISEKVYKKVPIFTQSGDDRYSNADKMILKGVGVLPHALINNVDEKLGRNGEILMEYVKWLKHRILTWHLKEDYAPIIHLDVYGTFGIIFNYDVNKMVDYMMEIEKELTPFLVRIEGPVDTGEREGTMQLLKAMTAELIKRGSRVEIVADEWCNTLEDIKYFADNKAGHMLQIKTPDLGGINNIVEAILYCNEKHIGSYCGGTCNETNISAQVTTNIAIACMADQCLAKPGMGVDEGYMIIKNEMNRVVALANSRNK